jgi:hypothetical protein
MKSIYGFIRRICFCNNFNEIYRYILYVYVSSEGIEFVFKLYRGVSSNR